MMAANALFRLLLIALVEIMSIQPAKATNIPRQSVNADIISLEEYGIVFKQGRLMSTSDVTHIQQGFVIEIPRRERRTEDTTAAQALCDRVRRTILGTTGYYDHVCGILRDTVEWLTLTTKALIYKWQDDKLTLWHHYPLMINNGIKGRRRKEKMRRKRKRSRISPVIMYSALVGAQTSGTTGIKVLNKAVDDNQEVLYEFMNTTDIALDQIHAFAELVMVMESKFLMLSSSVEKTFMEIRHAQKAAVLYQALLPMVLEEEMGRVIYLQDLLTCTKAFRKGMQYLVIPINRLAILAI